jgi:uncharacterized protein YndB with AHSA1/START domain
MDSAANPVGRTRGDTMNASPTTISLKRSFDAPPQAVWERLTTADGCEGWWAPEGFEVSVTDIDLRPGGQLLCTMTAVGAEQIAFVDGLGLPRVNAFRRTFTEVVAPERLAFLSLIDFIPDQPPYEHLTVIELQSAGRHTALTMTLDPLHDETWTRDYAAHRAAELDKLVTVLRSARAPEPRARA